MVNLDRRLKLRVTRRRQRARKLMARKAGGGVWVLVSRSNRAIYAQALDSAAGRTLLGVSSRGLVGQAAELSGVERARAVGELLGSQLKNLGITQVAFDRRGLKYHGRVAAVADGLRTSGVLK